jgi:hypothetical protein
MYEIEVEETGKPRPAEEDEVRGINAHREDYPRCDGTQVVDRGAQDQTLMIARPRLWCRDCRVKVPVPR